MSCRCGTPKLWETRYDEPRTSHAAAVLYQSRPDTDGATAMVLTQRGDDAASMPTSEQLMQLRDRLAEPPSTHPANAFVADVLRAAGLKGVPLINDAEETRLIANWSRLRRGDRPIRTSR